MLFDDLGAPAEKAYLIQEGHLKRGLGSLESQKRLNIPWRCQCAFFFLE